MEQITGDQGIDKAFNFVRKRRHFFYQYSHDLWFVYYPINSERAIVTVGYANSMPDYAFDLLSDMGIFVRGEGRPHEIQNWKCRSFLSERFELN